MDVRLIAAVGRRGQLGLGDRLPWHDPEDLRWFREQTTGCAVVVGWRTYATIPNLPGRELWVWNGKDEPDVVLAAIHAGRQHARLPTNAPIWIAGGAKTYAAFMPLVRRAVVTLVDYDGPADVWMPPLWQAGPDPRLVGAATAIPPRPPAGVEFTDDFKVRCFDAAQTALYGGKP